MTPVQNLAPGTICVSREKLDGQLRVTVRRRIVGESSGYVATELLAVTQWWGVDPEVDEIKYQWEGCTPCWTHGLFPVEPQP